MSTCHGLCRSGSSSIASLDRLPLQSPKERITLQEVMKHPWVTMDGKFPLKSYRDLRPGETNDAHDGLVTGMTYEECNPRPQGLPDLLHLSSHERTFSAGEVIMRQGEIGGVMGVSLKAFKAGKLLIAGMFSLDMLSASVGS